MSQSPPQPEEVENETSSALLKEAISKNIAKQEFHNAKEPLYHPSIFRYRCRGIFSATSDEPGSNGICWGIQSKLKHVRDLPRSTEKESVNAFLQAANYVNNDEGANDVTESTAMIYDPKPSAKTPNETLGSVSSPHNSLKSQSKTQDEWHDWDTYGSTDVHVLILRDAKTNEEKTAGLAPDCRLGVSRRDIGKEKVGGESITSIRIGPVEVKIVNQYEHHNPTKQQDASSVGGKEKVDTPVNLQKKEEVQEKNKTGEGITFEKVYDKSGKIVNAMKSNAVILRDAVSEDFPSRCWEASQRVTAQFGKTLDRTSKLASDLYNIWKEDDE
mmetsp:Transcript_15879/g.24050  ORF Transcript_15879/g.24050 Transcript_15879/m.24050 type:complete len:329 (+) Transcript_15879:41-1027(+)